MGKLVSHSYANKMRFEKGCGPSKSKWFSWVDSKLIEGKIIGDDVFIDLDKFDALDIIKKPKIESSEVDDILRSMSGG